MISIVKKRITMIVGLLGLIASFFLYYAEKSETSIKNGSKITNTVEYVNGEINFIPVHTQQELAQIFKDLKSGKINSKNIDEVTFWELVNYIKQCEALDSNNQQDILLLHELAKIYRTTQFAQDEFTYSLADNGATPASQEVIDCVDNILKEKKCPVLDVPVYKLTNDSDATGITTSHGIWIRDQDLGNNKKTIIHEVGHWIFQHDFRQIVDNNISQATIEYEADNFAYNELTKQERMNITKAVLGLDPEIEISMPEPYYSNWIRIAQEHGEHPHMRA